MKKFSIIKKSNNYYAISYFDENVVNSYCEVEITSANSKSKAKKKKKLIEKVYKLGYRDGYN